MGLSALNIPFKELELIEIKKVIYRFVFNKYSYTIYPDLLISKEITKWPNSPSFVNTSVFYKDYIERKLQPHEIDALKKFNNYDQKVKDANIDNLLKISEYAYFLYKNQNVIKKTKK